jgi:RNA polymerase sigma-70 factor (ECF subfamily)
MEPDNAQTDESRELLVRLKRGDQSALATLFMRYRGRLRRMVDLRMDRRLAGRIDTSDVLQEAYLDASRQLNGYLNREPMPLFLWFRLITGQRLMAMHRRHLGARKRDARQEVGIHQSAMPPPGSAVLSRQLPGRLTSPSGAAIRREERHRLRSLLDRLEPPDREILAIRHFENLSNDEAARELGISKAAASKRHVRALERFRKLLAEIPGLLDGNMGKGPG